MWARLRQCVPLPATHARAPACARAWPQLPKKLEGIVSMAPACGLLRGNEAVQVAWTFVPLKEKTYDAK